MPIDYNRRVQEEDTTIGTPSGIVSSSTPQANPSSQGSGQFSNLQDYVRANQGEKNATATRVGADVGNKYNAALSDVNTGVSQIGQQKQALDTQRNQFNNIVANAGTSSITPEQIANARNMALGISGVDVTPRTQASSILSQSEATKQAKANELKNIGSGSGIQNYLRSVRENPSSSTTGELRLDEFLTRQTPEGASQLENATSKGTQLAANQQLQNAVGQVENSYANLSPTSLSDYVKQNRALYQTGLGDINKQRAATVSMENRGISNLSNAEAAYRNAIENAKASDQTLAGYLRSINQNNANINAYNDQIAQIDQFAGTGNVAKLEELMKLNNIAPAESANVNPKYGNRTNALRNDLINGLQRLRAQRQAEIDATNASIAQRQAELASSVQATDPYYQYTMDVANANTRQNALRASEMARLQALYSMSGEEDAYRNYLAGGLS